MFVLQAHRLIARRQTHASGCHHQSGVLVATRSYKIDEAVKINHCFLIDCGAAK
jgi:hypothetical protein